MHYNYEYTLRYQDADHTHHVRLNIIEDYLLEVAGTVADDLNFGIKALHPRGLTWILTNMSLELLETPCHGDHLRFETWIESNAHMLSVRDFRIYRGDELIGKCKSVWAVLDLEKREIVNIFDDPMFENSIDGEVLEMARAPRLRTVAEPFETIDGCVLYSDLDYNGHCNSCHYLEKMLNAYRPEWLYGPIRLDISYQRELMPEESYSLRYHVEENAIQYQLQNAAALSSCIASLTKMA